MANIKKYYKNHTHALKLLEPAGNYMFHMLQHTAYLCDSFDSHNQETSIP